MITGMDKQNFLQLQELLDTNPNQAVSMMKILAGFVENITPNNVELLKKHLHDNKKALSDLQETRALMKTMLEEIADIAEQERIDRGKKYTTGELAYYFGVSTTTINNWIKEGRFIGVEKTVKYKQARISENVLFHFNNGEILPVSQVVEWREQQMRDLGAREMTDEEVKQVLLEDIAVYEKKYGGSYEMTLGALTKKTREQYWDASEWEFLLRSLGGYE